MDGSLEQGLFTVHPDILNRKTWEAVGMALKNEGLPRDVWERWTRVGNEFDPAECAGLWHDFYPEGSYIPMTLEDKLPGRRMLLRLIGSVGVPGRTLTPREDHAALTAEAQESGETPPQEEKKDEPESSRAPDNARREPTDEAPQPDGPTDEPESSRAPDNARREPTDEAPQPDVPTEKDEPSEDGTDCPEDTWRNASDAGDAPQWFGRKPPQTLFADGLPAAMPLTLCRAISPRQPEELIAGVLRRGHKMLLSGSSKAGKSFLLMELCAAIAEGGSWLGFPCKKGRVLYVNLEIDPASAVNRFLRIYQALKLDPDRAANISMWNLRGHARPIDRLAAPLIQRLQDGCFDAVVVDPIYKVLTGDENNATDMSAFCNYLDAICEQTECAVICCHHHSKGDQSGKRVTDRASGSGVFARDPDAQLDVMELFPDNTQRRAAKPGATAWRMESSLREFPNIAPLDFWFEYPLHRRDTDGALASAPTCLKK